MNNLSRLLLLISYSGVDPSTKDKVTTYLNSNDKLVFYFGFVQGYDTLIIEPLDNNYRTLLACLLSILLFFDNASMIQVTVKYNNVDTKVLYS